jgi:hypothetical protein
VWTSFSRHSPDWQVVKEFSLANSENNSGSGEQESVKEKKNLPSWRVGFYF